MSTVLWVILFALWAGLAVALAHCVIMEGRRRRERDMELRRRIRRYAMDEVERTGRPW